ncbi:head-tail connector protein [Cytobacillus oceanisediminis]|uniref:head-tail connector protein n=1 Tax=Cytobacillus oceanisediminis TaxID=665099 RepID=UPI001CC97986|nr:head-tail connector protein [Cytobacillus oceanisediminis]MBZ9535944.1 head-tail connector protein [Cytobacillus oceanisediminis]
MNYIGTMPKFSEIDLDFMKNYLYLDEDTEDELVTLLLVSAKEQVLFYAGINDETILNTSSLASIIVLQLVSDNFNSRSAISTGVSFSPIHLEMVKTLRGKFNGYKIG